MPLPQLGALSSLVDGFEAPARPAWTVSLLLAADTPSADVSGVARQFNDRYDARGVAVVWVDSPAADAAAVERFATDVPPGSNGTSRSHGARAATRHCPPSREPGAMRRSERGASRPIAFLVRYPCLVVRGAIERQVPFKARKMAGLRRRCGTAPAHR